jgi:regulator of sigma E protease
VRLKGLDSREAVNLSEDLKLVSADELAVLARDVITSINGKPVDVADYPALDRALQQSEGKPVVLGVLRADGKEEQVSIHPHFWPPFGDGALNFAGMVPRIEVGGVSKESDTLGKLLPGDVITALTTGSGRDTLQDPSPGMLIDRLKGSQEGALVDVTVLRTRDGKTERISLNGLKTRKIPNGKRGLGISPSYDEASAIVAEVLQNSAADAAHIPSRATIVKVGGSATSSWHDVQAAMIKWLDQHPGGSAAVPISYKTEAEGMPRATELNLNGAQIAEVRSHRYRHSLTLDEPLFERKTEKLLQAAGWGVIETRDFILQFYITLRRMISGDVSPKNMMGPVGIFHAGTKFAGKGTDWLIWFLAMISANLAVVNFLPIPIVDGGLFTFLIAEKIKGKPLSAKTQTIAQYVGMALLLGVFLLVTYQDITRVFSFLG